MNERWIRAARVPLVAAVAGMMLAGMWAGLARMGWALPYVSGAGIVSHGALMISGVLGTLIGLERAIAYAALKRSNAAYVVPIFTALGALALLLGIGGDAGKWLITLGSLGLIGVFVVFWRIHAANFVAVMGLGALAWLGGNLLWLSGQPVFRAAPLWMSFLILTIVGERLELSRVRRLTPRQQTLLLCAAVLFVVGGALAGLGADAGYRLAGLGQIALALWLLRYDIARHTLRRDGLTRFIGTCLSVGYLWLGFGGVLSLLLGELRAGMYYDAALHAVFLGFVFSMIFGHAPMILPSVTGWQMAYSPLFYAPLALLHGSLVIRIAGDLSANVGLRQWGGMLNMVAILMFLAVTIRSVVLMKNNKKRP